MAPGGGSMGGGRGSYSQQDVRQYTREFRERRAEAERLRRQLGAAGADTRELDRAIGRMRDLESDRIYDDPAEVARLHAAVIQGLKAYEFALRRQLEGGEKERLHLGGSEDVPAGFRQLVEEYYRSLSTSGRKP